MWSVWGCAGSWAWTPTASQPGLPPAWCKNTSRPQNSPWLFFCCCPASSRGTYWLPSVGPSPLPLASVAHAPKQDPVPGGNPAPGTRMQLEEYLKCLFYSCSYNTVSLWQRTVAPQQSWEEGWLLTLCKRKREGKVCAGLAKHHVPPLGTTAERRSQYLHCWFPQDTPEDQGLQWLLVPVAALQPVAPSP